MQHLASVRSKSGSSVSRVCSLAGLTFALYGITLWNSRYYLGRSTCPAGRDPHFRKGRGNGVQWFFELSYDVNMSAGLLILVRVISVGALMWRRGRTAQMAEKMERNTDWTS